MKPVDVSRATAQLEAAQAALDLALASGGDTQRARDDLQAAEARLAALTAPALAPAQDEDEDLQDEARSMAEPVRVAIDDLLTNLLAIERPAILDVEPAAMQLIRTRRQAAQVADLAADRQSRLDGLRDRLAALEGERQGVIARRLTGDQRPDDAAVVALLDADREGLNALIARVEAEPVPVMPGVEAAERQWAVAVQRTEQMAVASLVTRLEAALLAAVDALGRTPWSDRPPISRRIMAACSSRTGKW